MKTKRKEWVSYAEACEAVALLLSYLGIDEAQGGLIVTTMFNSSNPKEDAYRVGTLSHVKERLLA